jgi:hypothetical protein
LLSGPNAETKGDLWNHRNSGEFRYHWQHGNRGMAFDLHVPTNEAPAIEKVVAELNLKGRAEDDVLKTLRTFFETKFTYRMWQDADNSSGREDTPLSRFLLKTRSGHCEYFATATVLLLREVGIPARYAVGYSVHEAGMDGYIVRQRDAHAWCLVWNENKKVWEDFDTTPGTWEEIEFQHRSASLWFSDAWWWARFQFSKLRWGQTQLREYILIGLVPVLGLLLFQIVRQRRRQGLRGGGGAGRLAPWPGLDSEFYEIENRLAQRGLVRGPNETLADWLERAATEPSLAGLNLPLRALLRLHYRYRFDPEGLSDTDRQALGRDARECLEKLSRLDQASPA